MGTMFDAMDTGFNSRFFKSTSPSDVAQYHKIKTLCENIAEMPRPFKMIAKIT
jgi:hypothetical protein